MNKSKEILYVVLESVLLVGICGGCYFSKVFTWIFLGILFLTLLLVLLFFWQLKMIQKYPERKRGKLWQKIVKSGMLSTVMLSDCETNTFYSDKKEIERRSHVQLPDFRVVSCKETKPDYAGDFFGQMEIEFHEDFSSETRNQLRSRHSKNKIKINLSDDTENWWNIKLSLDSRTALIRYGRMAYWLY